MAGIVHVQTNAPPPNSVTVTTPGLTFSPERVEIPVGWSDMGGRGHDVQRHF